MNVVTYNGEKPEIKSDPNFKLVVELMIKQCEVLKRFGVSCAIVSAATKVNIESDREIDE